ncbi:hypothetical protein L3Y34_007990 [Caenorhabditis briggsae]|uniref:Uncharacterized protein n=1 Tax=Caenorhabditis briggsae TaxID=6238 RepID=A0AAE9A5I5_CAEBR|nr:hypothetical protein L3Y34_007990 [Caenorhabditis briggsae]ULT89203.1 hypothetical protein L3Y34_007990 [Caenorhabditis briggsae]
MEENPLRCTICKNDFEEPILFSCQHTTCRKCSNGSPSCKTCSPGPSTSRSHTPQPDKLAAFLLDASKEEMEQCANCEQITLPMFYCETCQQSLCLACRNVTHQARMFSSHKIISSEERSKVYSSSLCKDHNEPYILYCSDVRKLVCIQCFNGRPLEERHSFISIEQGHRMCLEKIEQSAAKLRFYQSERQEELNVRQRILDENASNFDDAKTSLYQLCQQIIDTVMTTRETLAKELVKQQEQSDEQCKRQIKEIEAVMGPVRLCLFSAQILCTTASKLDVLQLCPQLQKRISVLLDKTVDKLPVSSTPDSIEVRSDLAKSLEPYLGMSAAWCPISVSREGSSSNSYKRGSGSHKALSMLSKFQTTIDLAGAFGQLFGKVEHPLRQLVVELSSISQQVLETQRDLTIRRCIIEKEDVEKLVKMCKKIEASLGMHSAALDGMQSEMQEIWQEQLDRVRRQQIIYREKVEEILNLRETARQILTAAKQMVPYVSCILNMNAMIAPKRCHPPDPAPMESICLEITGIEPNSQNRIMAIEKEEENRRLNQEAKKKEELAGQSAAMKSLKHGKTKRKEMHHRMMLNTNRERSPGGTDSALTSPCIRRLTSTALKEETASELDAEEILDEIFELSGEQYEEVVDGTLTEEDRCSSALLLSLELQNESVSPLPSLEQLLGRISLASRVTSDIGFSRGAMLQSLNDVFALQKPPTPENISVSEERNVLASAVRNAEKRKSGAGLPTTSEKEEMIENDEIIVEKETETEKKKVIRRRVKKAECEQSEEDVTTTFTFGPPPDCPFVPQEIFDKLGESDEKLGTFEAKERVLQSLKQKMNQKNGIDNDN